MKQDNAGKADVLQGTLILLVLRTLEALGPLHGYGIARRIEQISKDLLQLNQGTLYPALLRNGAGGMDHVQVGSVGEEPEGEVLCDQRGRSETAREGNKRLAADVVDDRALPWC